VVLKRKISKLKIGKFALMQKFSVPFVFLLILNFNVVEDILVVLQLFFLLREKTKENHRNCEQENTINF
jgi:hypothetical protein